MFTGVKMNAEESDASGDSFIILSFLQVLGLQTQLSGQTASCTAFVMTNQEGSSLHGLMQDL